MESIETLKQELKAQKEAVESKGGTVIVSNNNPSPSEITAGIESIPIFTFKETTATEADVKEGKTYYNGDGELRTGILATYDYDLEMMKHTTFYNESVKMSEQTMRVEVPVGTRHIRQYGFAYNPNYIEFYFNSDLQEIKNHAFYNCVNFTFPIFSSLENLTHIGAYCFSGVKAGTFDLENLPPNLRVLSERSFNNIAVEGTSIIIPDKIEVMAAYVFASSTKLQMNTFVYPSIIPYQNLSGGLLQNLCFDCDFTIPPNVRLVCERFNFSGSFNNITVPSTCINIQSQAFGGASTEPVSDFKLKTATFESLNPPYFTTNVFAPQNKTNNFKIYVPDESIEAYKAAYGFSNYADYIYPMSQKE